MAQNISTLASYAHIAYLACPSRKLVMISTQWPVSIVSRVALKVRTATPLVLGHYIGTGELDDSVE